MLSSFSFIIGERDISHDISRKQSVQHQSQKDVETNIITKASRNVLKDSFIKVFIHTHLLYEFIKSMSTSIIMFDVTMLSIN